MSDATHDGDPVDGSGEPSVDETAARLCLSDRAGRTGWAAASSGVSGAGSGCTGSAINAPIPGRRR